MYLNVQIKSLKTYSLFIKVLLYAPLFCNRWLVKALVTPTLKIQEKNPSPTIKHCSVPVLLVHLCPFGFGPTFSSGIFLFFFLFCYFFLFIYFFPLTCL